MRPSRYGLEHRLRIAVGLDPSTYAINRYKNVTFCRQNANKRAYLVLPQMRINMFSRCCLFRTCS